MTATATIQRKGTPGQSRHRGRPRKGMATAAIAPDIFDTVPMMRLSARYGTKGMAAAVVVICAISRAGYCLEWTEREKWTTLRLLPGMEAEELDETVKAMAVMGLLDEATYVRHGVLTSRDIQAAYFAAHRRSASLPYIIADEAECKAEAETADADKATDASTDVRANVTVYAADGIVYYGSQTVYNGQTYAKPSDSYKKADLMQESADLMQENDRLSGNNAGKEKETKKETDKENTPAPPKEREKEINKEKETADVVPTSVSCRPEADDDAARKAECSATGKGGSLSKTKTAATAKDGIDYATVRREWNRLMQGTGIPQLRSEITGQRQRMFRARVREYGKNSVWGVMCKASASTYLGGGGPSGWTATFDWLMRPSNFQKVLDGHYDNSRTEARRRRVVLGSARI